MHIILQNDILIEHFVKFGTISDAQNRRELVKQIREVLTGRRTEVETFCQELKPYIDSVNTILQNQVGQFCKENPTLGAEIIQTLLEHLKETGQIVEACPYPNTEEEKYIQEQAVNDELLEMIIKHQEFGYTDSEINFYKQKEKELTDQLKSLEAKINTIKLYFEEKQKNLKNLLRGKLDLKTNTFMTNEDLLNEDILPLKEDKKKYMKNCLFLRIVF
jgi:predicted nucleic-acid-binding protein